MSSIVEKIGALLAKAESTDNEHERHAYVTKAQELATLNAIDLEAARLRQVEKTKREVPIVKNIRLFDHFDRSQTKAHFIWLFSQIAGANDVKINIFHDNTGVIAFGYPSDIEVCEALHASLSTQMVAEAEAYLKKGEYKQEMVTYEKYDYYEGTTYQTKPMNGKTARRNFYQGFYIQVGERLRAARKQAIDNAPEVQTDTGTTSAALVLVNKNDEIKSFYNENSNARGSWRGGAGGAYSAGANNAGRAAGNRADLGSRKGSIGSRQAIGA